MSIATSRTRCGTGIRRSAVRGSIQFSAARTARDYRLTSLWLPHVNTSRDHAKTIESLELTIKADSELIQRMRTFSKKRNATSYDLAGNVSAQELELAIRTANELQRTVVTWLEKNHPELLKESV